MNNDWLTMEAIVKGAIIALVSFIITIIPVNISLKMTAPECNLIKQYLNIRDYGVDVVYRNFGRGVKDYHNKLVNNDVIYKPQFQQEVIEHYKKELYQNGWRHEGIQRSFPTYRSTELVWDSYRKDNISVKIYSSYPGLIRFNYELH